MDDFVGAMRMLDDLREEDAMKVCHSTIYNLFGFLDLQNNKSMNRAQLDDFIKMNIKNIKRS